MNRRDYMLLAGIINDIEDEHVRRVCAKEIAYGLAKADPSFYMDVFLKVCMDASVPRTLLLKEIKRPAGDWTYRW